MGLLSNTGLLASVAPQKQGNTKQSMQNIELKCEVTPAPFMLRPFAGLYNPFSHNCSVLCNHPADTHAKDFLKRAKDAWGLEGKGLNQCMGDEMGRYDQSEKEKNKIPHDIVTEDMFRRYTETDSRPLTPAPTLASGKSRGSRRCLTPDQPHTKTTIVLDLRRSHSQETLYYHGYTTSDMTIGQTSVTNDRSTLPSLNLSEATHNRLIKGQCEQLPPLASPLVLAKRTMPVKEAGPPVLKGVKKAQLKALNLGKPTKSKKGETPVPPVSQRSKSDAKEKDSNDGSETARGAIDDGAEVRRRGKRRRKGRAGSDRLTSAGLAAQTEQDPETQIAGIGTESHNPSSRSSVVPPADDDVIVLPVIKPGAAKKTDSFLDDEILKYLHREVDQEAIETEFDIKRRYVLEEALRTRPERAYGLEMQALMRELRSTPAVSLGDWLHVPRVFSRQNAHFTLPIDSNVLQTLTPMQYAARFVTIKKSKQLLYLTVIRKFRPEGYRMPIKDIQDGLVLMMGGILTIQQAERFKTIMGWDGYVEEESIPDEIKLTLLDLGRRKALEGGDNGESDVNTLKYRTWCGLCAICERMFGRFPPRSEDSPDGMELSDFTMVETKLAAMKVHSGLVQVLNVIRTR